MTKRRKKVLGKQISAAYHILSIVNTMSVMLTGDPKKILKHLMRKRMVRRAGRLI